MKRNILTLAIATQFAAFGAVAQTDTTGMAGTGMDSFGSDWSESLGAAIFDDDGTTVRSEDDLSSEWSNLSSEDQDMLRRDCEAYMAQAEDGSDGGDTGTDTTGSAAATTDGSGTITADATGSADTATGGAAGSADVATGTDTTTGGTAGAAAGAETDMATDTDADTGMEVSMDQMEEICAAVEDEL